MLRLLFAILVAGAAALAPGTGHAEKRAALVLGNGAYQHAPTLTNPANDAKAMGELLRGLGFEVIEGTDLDGNAMRRVVQEFSRRLEGKDVALFFYAGHGMQVYGKNYLIPVDAVLSSETDLDFSAIDVDLVLRQMDREPRVKIAILDACRDNPLSKNLARGMGRTRSAEALQPGLAKINSGVGTLIAFATDPGAVALDGETRHSPFTESLVEHLGTPGVEIQVAMTRVRGEVYKKTRDQQLPWVNTSLTGEFYMQPTATPEANPADDKAKPPVARTTDPGFDAREMELALWRAADSSQDPADYKEYLRLYPTGHFAGLAQNRLERLQKGQAPAPERQDSGRSTAAHEGAEAAEQGLGLSIARRSELQQRLTLLGHATGGSDGSFGPRTRKAISTWQTASGFAGTGYLGPADYEALLRQSQPAWDQRRAAEAEARRRNDERRAAEARYAPPAPPHQPPQYNPYPPQNPNAPPQPQQPPQQGPSVRDAVDGIKATRDIMRMLGR